MRDIQPKPDCQKCKGTGAYLAAGPEDDPMPERCELCFPEAPVSTDVKGVHCEECGVAFVVPADWSDEGEGWVCSACEGPPPF